MAVRLTFVMFTGCVRFTGEVHIFFGIRGGKGGNKSASRARDTACLGACLSWELHRYLTSLLSCDVLKPLLLGLGAITHRFQ